MDGAIAFAGLDQQGLLQKGFEPSVSWNTLGRQSLPADKSYTPTGVTLMAALVYDKATMTSPPSTWQQLLSSSYQGQVGMNDPSQSRCAGGPPMARSRWNCPGRRRHGRSALRSGPSRPRRGRSAPRAGPAHRRGGRAADGPADRGRAVRQPRG